MQILVTGGAGYIGSHTCLELLNAGHELTVLDNLCNSSREPLERVKELTGKALSFIETDLLDRPQLSAVFVENSIDAVIHFAALKAIGESVEQPLAYYDNNVSGTINLLNIMQQTQCKKLVYSSSCTVYGEPQETPITEDHPIGTAESPYGWTKLLTEQIMRDLYASDSEWDLTLLRYFNPVGAHPSGQIGEDPRGVPTNLMPYITQVAVGRLPKLRVFGNDYPTPDGTGVRDYIHVVELAQAHVRAVEMSGSDGGMATYNLGTGRGSSVLELVAAFEDATGIEIPCEIVARRPGDVAVAYANPAKAERELGWKTQFDLADICRDSWNWQQKNPAGYG
jgi:UDP-glucose 4-epimerase